MHAHALPFPVPSTQGRRAAALLMLGVFLALASGGAAAVDLTALGTIGGPLSSALTQLQGLGPGLRALVGFIAFVVAFITLAALKNMGPVLFYVGVMIFGAVGLPIGGAILGAVI